MKPIYLLLALFALLLPSCQRDENLPKASTSSGGTLAISTNKAIILTPTDWRFNVDEGGNQRNANNYRQTFVSSSSVSSLPMSSTGFVGVPTKSSSYTLGMATSFITDTASYCYWGYRQHPPTGLRIGQTLTLKAKVKLNDVQGQGISLALRGDKGTKTALLFSSTQDRQLIRGSANDVEYSVSLPYTQLVDVVSLYLILLPQTTGTVTFSDVALLAN